MFIKKFFRRLFPTKEKRLYNKMHKRHRKELIKHAKETAEYDWGWLHDSIMMQIRHMYEYYTSGNNVWQADSSRLEIVDQLKAVQDVEKEIKELEDAPFCYGLNSKQSYIELPNGERLTTLESIAREEELYIKLYSLIGKYLRYWWD